jgi:cytochrome c-type biogenesis protein CcmH/NrfG
MGNQAGATDAFEGAVKLDPDELKGGLLLAGAYRAQGRAQEACDVLRSVREPNPEQREQMNQALVGCPPR